LQADPFEGSDRFSSHALQDLSLMGFKLIRDSRLEIRDFDFVLFIPNLEFRTGRLE
jgi:hypothetical protein